jgi:hypothetical protein
MKTILPGLIVLLVSCGTATTKIVDTTFPIPSYPSEQKNIAPDTAKHKAGDVDVFRLVGKDTAYFARLYRLDGGEVRRYETVIMERVNYDRASYEWLNDSTVSFRLIDTKNNKTQAFQLIGSGASTTVQDIK